jgi:hypothetical protein
MKDVKGMKGFLVFSEETLKALSCPSNLHALQFILFGLLILAPLSGIVSRRSDDAALVPDEPGNQVVGHESPSTSSEARPAHPPHTRAGIALSDTAALTSPG